MREEKEGQVDDWGGGSGAKRKIRKKKSGLNRKKGKKMDAQAILLKGWEGEGGRHEKKKKRKKKKKKWCSLGIRVRGGGGGVDTKGIGVGGKS